MTDKNTDNQGNAVSKKEQSYSFKDFTEWIWSPPSSSQPVWKQKLQAFLRIFIILFREFFHDQILLRSSALTFTVVLSLVPTLAFGTAVLKGLGAGDQLRQAAYRYIDQLEVMSWLLTPQPEMEDVHKKLAKEAKKSAQEQAENKGATEALPGTAGSEQPAQEQPPEKMKSPQSNFTGHLRKAVDQLFDYVDRIDFATLGTFGITFLLLSVLFVLDSIEQSMNVIWQSKSHRPISRKVMDYLGMMILVPIAIIIAFAIDAALRNPAWMPHIVGYLPVAGLGRFLLSLIPAFSVVATFAILYKILPNTKVRLMSVIIGGLFGGVIWLLVQKLYVTLQLGVARYNAIYGSFATLPLFLLWIYLGWMVFLAGAEMSFAVQSWRHYRITDENPTPIARLALAFNIIEATIDDFRNRRVTDLEGLSQRLSQTDTTIRGVLDDLIEAEIIREADGKKEGYVPGAPAEKISPVEIVDLIFGTDVPPLRRSSLAIEALQAARNALAGKKLTSFEKDHARV